MSSWDKTGDRVAIVQLNAELRHAQLELLSAQCAADRLRLRFPAEDIARHAQRDILRRAVSSAAALQEFYSHVAKQVDDPGALLNGGPAWNGAMVEEVIDQLTRFLHEQRDHFAPLTAPLNDEQRKSVEPFFRSDTLGRIRWVQLDGDRISNPAFLAEARKHGFTNLPDFTHMHSLTLESVVVFQEMASPRTLFHALVHAVQFDVLGLRRYAELSVRSFLRTRSFITIPLEAHAFTLESKFSVDPTQIFSVEEKVRLWVNQGRYDH